MDPKKRKIYIAIIITCFLSTAVVLYWGFGGSGGSGAPPEFIEPVVTISTNNNNNAIADVDPVFTPPTVFPDRSNFDFSVLDSDLKQFQHYSPLVNDPNLLGRDNPFNNY